MGLKGLIRDTIMFIIGIALLLGWTERTTAGFALVAVALAFTAYAWFRFFKK